MSVLAITEEQGTPEWFAARVGIATASMFNKVITPTGKLSSQASSYIDMLLADEIAGEPFAKASTKWMDRGSEYEAEARDWIAFEFGVDVEQTGFLLNEELQAGCSPDGLIGLDTGLELKCPSPHVHIGYLRSQILPADYKLQVYGSMLVTGRKQWLFASYHPQLPPYAILVKQDLEFQEKIREALIGFRKAYLKAKGEVEEIFQRGFDFTLDD
jgi:hypothetical protein